MTTIADLLKPLEEKKPAEAKKPAAKPAKGG